MLIAKRNPTMKNARRAESGVFGTYALAVVALLGSVVTSAFLLGTTDGNQPAGDWTMATGEQASSFAPTAPDDFGPPVWVDPVGAAKAAAPESKGADLSTDQPYYDETAAVLVYTR